MRQILPIVRQDETTECGLACLVMIARFYGHKIDLAFARRFFKGSPQGIRLNQLVVLADSLQLVGRAVRVELDHLAKLRLPAILHWDMNHFVVLKEVSRNGTVIHDPACGPRRLTIPEFSKHFTGVALEVAAGPAFRPLQEQQRALRLTDLASKFSGVTRGVVQTVILSLVLQAVALVGPLYLQIGIDQVVSRGMVDFLFAIAIAFTGVFIIAYIARIVRSYVMLHLGSALGLQISANLFHHLLRLPIAYFERRHLGDTISRFNSLSPIRQFLAEGLAVSLVDGAMATTTLVVMFLYSPILGGTSALILALYLLLMFFTFDVVRSRNQAALIAAAHENSSFMEFIRRLQTIKGFGKESYCQQIWQSKLTDLVNRNIELETAKIWIQSSGSFLLALEYVVIGYLAISLVLADELSIGMVFAFLAYNTQFKERAKSVVDQVVSIRMLGLHLERIADIVREPQEATLYHGGGPKRDTVAGEIVLNDVSFRYGDDLHNVLKSIDLKVPSGALCAITGPSGCGKSTLLKVIAGILRPDSGTVLLDGRPVELIGLGQFRSETVSVMQDDDLFTGTIAENISFFDPDIDFERVVESATLACINDKIVNMKMSYETRIADIGTSISGGERQRIMLARALYSRPRILILDEALAHVDVHVQKRIMNSISSLGITRVVVSHRLETISAADIIYDVSKKQYLNVPSDRL